MKRIGWIVAILLSALSLLAQPSNDLCQTPFNLGSPVLGGQVCNAGTTVGANAENPYPGIASCGNFAGGSMGPAADVWYTLTTPAGTNSLSVNFTSTMDTASISVYTGTCGSLAAVECAVSATGNINDIISNMSPNTQVYIQVSGANVNDVSSFNLCITPTQQIGTCALQSSITASPQPTNGTYTPGTVVTFCYTVIEYDQQNANWFHGVELNFGAGWDASTLTPVSVANTCDGSGGTWGYYNNVTSTANGTNFGPGFFFDRDNNGNPGNNFGDNCTVGNWTFCWSIMVSNNPSSTDLSMGATPYGDSQSGSWSSPNCGNDPATSINSTVAGCAQPLVTTVDATCNGACDGSANLQPQGNDYPYSYSWSTGGVDSFETNLCPGVYDVTTTDGTGCTVATTIVILASGNLVVDVDSNDVSCVGAADGKAWATPTNGTGPYTYNWSTTPAQNTDTAFNLSPGSYTVTVTDNSGCSDTVSVSISAAVTINTRINKTDVSCNGGNNGSATITVTGGAPPYTYAWNTTPPQNTSTASGLVAGAYTVTVTDNNGCSITASTTINQPGTVNVSTSTDSVSCPGGADGRAWVNLSGATAPVTYNWSTTPTQNTDTATNLSAGIYDVTVTDGNGCSYTGSAEVFEGAGLSLSGFSDSVSCSGASNGRAWVEVTGGSAPYSYTWSAGNPIGTGDTITGVTAGNYTVTVSDVSGCTDSLTINVLQLANLNLTSGSDSATCAATQDGFAWVSASGGAGGFTYAWNTTPVQTNDTAFNLRGGNYVVTVTDLNGCQDTAQVRVGEPPAITLTTYTDSVSCNGGSDGTAGAYATGGVGSYTYAWPAGTPVGAGDSVTGLATGTYTLTVYDAYQCSATANFTIEEPTALALTNGADSVSCNGGNDGIAWAAASGGVPPYTYSWTVGIPNTTGDTVTGLPAGTVDVTVTDANGCQQTITGILIEEPAALTVSGTTTDVSCSGAGDGSVDITVTGGITPYSYLWSNGATTEDLNNLQTGSYTPTITDANGCTLTTTAFQINAPAGIATTTGADSASCGGSADGRVWVSANGGTTPYTITWSTTPAQNTDTATGLAAGTYLATVADVNGCFVVDSATVLEPSPVTLTVVNDSVSCNGGNDGQAWVRANGGTAPYTYNWNTTPAQTGDTATGLSAGSYTVTVTDANGCTVSGSTTVAQPLALTLSQTTNNVSCAGGSNGSINLTVAGATPPYTYQWANLGFNQQDPNNLPADTYAVTVIDARGCADSITNITITEPTPVVATAVVDSVTCNGGNDGAISVSASGGTGAYSYNWSNGYGQANQTSLALGSYTITVSDANSCRDTITETVGEPPALQVTSQQLNILCAGDTTGSVDLTVNGGSTPYTFNWNDGQTIEDRSSLSAGNYNVTIADANGCSTTRSFSITEPDSLNTEISLSLGDMSCDSNGTLMGTVYQQVTGGTAPYTYLWNTGETTLDATDMTASEYSVTVTDANGCIDSSAVIPNPYERLVTDIIVDSASCFGFADGDAEINVVSGQTPVTYEWPGLTATGRRAINLPAGDYSVIITDAFGCDTTIDFTITQQPEMTVDAGADITVPYASDSSLFASGIGVRPTDNVEWTWTPEEGLSCTDCPDPMVTPVRNVLYTVEMDVNGCVYIDSVLVEVNFDDKPYFAPNAFTPNNDGLNDLYQIYSRGVRKITWTVHNRWGQLVFRSYDLSDGWDGTVNGKEANEGVYVLHVFIQYEDGTSFRKSQSITLLR